MSTEVSSKFKRFKMDFGVLFWLEFKLKEGLVLSEGGSNGWVGVGVGAGALRSIVWLELGLFTNFSFRAKKKIWAMTKTVLHPKSNNQHFLEERIWHNVLVKKNPIS